MVGFFQGDVLLRSCLVPCSVGQGQIWLWFQDQTVFLSLALSSLLALVSGPGHISLTGSGSKTSPSLVQISGLKCFFHWLRFQGQGVFLGSGFMARVGFFGPFTLQLCFEINNKMIDPFFVTTKCSLSVKN